MLQRRLNVTCSVNGSRSAVSGSGNSSMSDSLMAWNPLMLLPSNPMPFSNRSSVSSAAGMEKCCHSPGMSTNFRSTISTLFFFARSRTSLTAIFQYPPSTLRVEFRALRDAAPNDRFAFTGTAHEHIDDADKRPAAGDGEANIRFFDGVGIAGDIEINDAAEHDNVRDHDEHGDDPVFEHAEIRFALEGDQCPHAG